MRLSKLTTWSITTRIGLLLFATVCGAVVTLSYTYSYFERTANHVPIVNLAGRQRMLSQVLFHYADMVVSGQPEDREDLSRFIVQFDDALCVLEQGGSVPLHQTELSARHSLHLPPPPPDLQPAIDKLRREWGLVMPLLLIVSNPQASIEELRKAFAIVKIRTDSLTRAADQVVLAYQGMDASISQRIRWAIYVTALFDLLFLVLGVWMTSHYVTERRRTLKELQQSEQDHRRLFENALDAILIFDPRSETILAANPGACEVYGYENDELVGKTLDLIQPEERRGHQKTKEILKENSSGSFALVHRRKNGSTVYIETNCSYINYRGRQAVLAINRDVTESKRTDRLLQSVARGVSEEVGEEFFRSLVREMATVLDIDYAFVGERSSDGKTIKTIALCAHGTIIDNFEYELPGTPCASIIEGGKLCSFPDNVQQRFPEDRLLIDMGIESYVGINLSDTSGVAIGLMSLMGTSPLKNANEAESILRIYAARASAEMQRLQVEEKLHRLSSALEQSPVLVVITDTAGIIQYTNPKFSETTGYTAEEAIGQTRRLLRSGEHNQEFYEKLWSTIRSGKVWVGRIKNRRKNGELYWERELIAPIHDRSGRIVSYVSMGEDISEELMAQQKLMESDKMAAIGTLAAGVTHEFKNFLGGIVANASFALDHLDEDGIELARETLNDIIDIGESASEVTTSLLTYSRSQSTISTSVDIEDLITRTLKLANKELSGLSIDVATHFDNVPQVRVSVGRIQQLFLNLILNAKHAIGSHGVITIAVSNTKEHIQVKVGDTGKGIPTSHMQRIFDPFFSTKGVWGTDEVAGTGLGLSICRSIARDHDGDLTVESVVGKGTTFTLSLPIAGVQEAAERDESQDSANRSSSLTSA